MVSLKRLSFIIIFCSVGGVIFYGFYDEKIHIDYSMRTTHIPLVNESVKSLTFFYSHNDSITATQKTYIINALNDNSVKTIINLWLSHFFEHNLKLHKIICHSLIIQNALCYCSFTTTPFTTTTSLYEKYSFFEGLLKTIFNIDQSIKGVVFLINHKPFEDADLDFSLAWSPHLYKDLT